MLFTRGATGWLGLGGTLATYRNRGAQGALMSLRIREALSMGCDTVATETGEPVGDEPNPSLANMFRSGFDRVCSRENFAPPG